jgi:short-subunit dehydrogenase
LALRGAGYRVFATVRNIHDARELSDAGCEPCLMDITDDEQVQRCRSQILSALGAGSMAGLVNAAGVASMGPLENTDVAVLRAVMEVNILGTVAVTRAFLPRLRQDGGRILMVGSVTGRLANPFFGIYAASRFALRALADALRRELAGSDVAVIHLEVGTTRTAIWGKLETTARVENLYAARVERLRARMRAHRNGGMEPELVAREICRLLAARRPPSNRLIVGHWRWLYWLYLRLPSTFQDWLLWRRG